MVAIGLVVVNLTTKTSGLSLLGYMIFAFEQTDKHWLMLSRLPTLVFPQVLELTSLGCRDWPRKLVRSIAQNKTVRC